MLRTQGLSAIMCAIIGVTAVQAAVKDGIPWRKDLKAAMAEGRKSDKPVLIRFYADWCPPCRSMARDTWPDKKISTITRSFVPVLLEFDTAREVRRRYDVRVVPYALVVSPTGKVLGRARGNQPSFNLWHVLDQALQDRELEKAGLERGNRFR